MAAPTTNLRSHDIPPPVPSARASLSISDSSRPRGRVIFLPRRPLRVRRQMRSIPRPGRRSISSPTHTASQTIVEGGCSNDPKPVSRGTGTETQHQSHPDCGTRPGSNMFSNSAWNSEADLVALEDDRRTVSSLRSSEISLSTPLRKLSSSTPRRDTPDRSRTEALTYATTLRTSAAEMLDGPIDDVDNELVEAISRNVAQQLHLLSIKDESKRMNTSSKKPTPRKPENLSNESRTPSQSAALNRFIWELRQYAEQSGAKGRLPILTPTPPHSGASLHTIKALLPFRSEFKAAGLAITSKDQAKSSSRPASPGKARLTTNQALRSRSKQHLTQMDGNAGCPSSSTEIPFPPAKHMDEWRYAMVDQQTPEQSTTVTTVQKESRVCCPPCQPDDLCLSGDWNCLKLLQKPKPLYTESLYKEPLTGPTAKIPQDQMHTFPNWPNMVSPEKRKSHLREGLDEDAPSPTSRASQNKEKMKESKQAFFSGPKTPTVYSTLAKGLIMPHDHRPSLKDYPQATRKRSQEYKHRPVESDQDQSPCSRPVQSMKNLKHPLLTQPTPKRPHSLSADILVPQQLQSTKGYSKPLPEVPRPEPSSTFTEQSCRLSTEAIILPTPNKVPVDKGKGKASPRTGNDYQDSMVPPNHVTVCSRGFSAQRVGRPNVPKRTSSIRSLRAKHQEHDQGDIMDRDVLRGLHIAASAACNEQIDTFIHEQTGLHIRQFLANLMPLESLGNKPFRDTKERRARRRRAEIREVKRRVRKSRQSREQSVY